MNFKRFTQKYFSLAEWRCYKQQVNINNPFRAG